MIVTKKKAAAELEIRLLNINRERIREIFAALPVLPEQRDAIDSHVERFCLQASFAALYSNPELVRPGTKTETTRLRKIEELTYLRLEEIGKLGTLGREALQAFVEKEWPKSRRISLAQARFWAMMCGAKGKANNENLAWFRAALLLKASPALTLDRIARIDLMLLRAIPNAIAQLEGKPPTKSKKGAIPKILADKIADAAALPYKELTGEEATRIVDPSKPGGPVKVAGYVALLSRLYKELGIKASVDNMSKGRSRDKRAGSG